MIISIDRLPPSVNHMYGRTRNGITYITKEAKNFKNELGWIAKQKKSNFGSEKVRVDIIFKIKDKRRRDPDNLLKATLDSLKKVVVDDDSQFIHGSWTMMNGQYDRTIIEIEKIENDCK
jgi:crossover junction endodeoxyribonuclease RusA